MSPETEPLPIGVFALLRLIRACTTTRTRLLLVAMTTASMLLRLGVVAAAAEVARQRYALGSVIGVASIVVGLVQRVASFSLRLRTDLETVEHVSDVLLDADLFALTPAVIRTSVGRGIWNLQEVVVALPSMCSDLLVSLLLVPVIATRVPDRILVLVGVGVMFFTVLVIPIQRATLRLHAHASAARLTVATTFDRVIEGRLELVAMGAERQYRRELRTDIERYRERIRRSSLGAAFLGRVPLALAVGVLALVTAFDSDSRAALTDALERWGLVFAASLPPMFGVLGSLQTLTRARAMLTPLSEIVHAPPRAEIRRVVSGQTVDPEAFRVSHLSFAYEDKAPVVADVSFEWKRGAILMVVGRNGAGKSTLLRLLLGLCEPSAGTIEVDGIDLASLNRSALRAATAFLPQRPYLGDGTVRDAFQLARARPSDEDCMVALARARLHLGRAPLDRRVVDLSTGERQRLALARLVMQEPTRVVVLDEPEANLDREGIDATKALIRELAAEGKLVAVAAHASELVDIGDVTVSF